MSPRISQKNLKRFALVLSLSLVVGLILALGVSQRRVEEAPTDPPLAPSYAEGEKPFCLLLAAKDPTSGLSDVMMLLSFDPQRSEVTVLQIPRDTYFRGGSESYRKINGAPAAIGMETLSRRLGDAFGISVDAYLRLSSDAFRRAVDALGGVELDVPEDMNYEDPAQGLSIHLKKGRQTLDGKTAEGFVRYRSGYGRGDLDRLDAQKLFLSALAKKVMAMEGSASAVSLAAALLPCTETDLAISEVAALWETLKDGRETKLAFVTAPGAEVTGRDGGSYYSLSAPAMEELLAQRFGAERAFDPEGLFLHESHEDFVRAYRTYADYRLWTE